MGVTVRVPAKVNLHLGVGPRRPDGYHGLATVFHAVSMTDEVVVEAGEPGSGVHLEMSGPGTEGLPRDEGNLAVRAALALAREAGRAADLRIRVAKAIPVAGGMAGGSADAAAVLVATAALWGHSTAAVDLAPVAATLGSDVPFALLGGTAIGTGRGEVVVPALHAGTLDWVVAIADGSLATPAVYAECDRLRGDAEIAEPVVPADLIRALRSGDPRGIAEGLANDLQAAAVSLRPALAEVLDVGVEAGALAGIVSGSGPTCAFLVADRERGLDVAAALSTCVGIARAIPASGPVPGARIVSVDRP